MAERRTEPRILVTDAGRGSAIAIIRALGRTGCHVIAGDADANSLGFRSRYASETFVYPDPRDELEHFLEVLLSTVCQRGVDLVIPVTDFVMQPLAQARDAFDPHTKLAIPTNESLAIVTNKERTVELARGLGVPVPETRVVHSVREAVQQAQDLGWPVVLKPQSSHLLRDGRASARFKVTYAASTTDVEAKMARFEGRCAVLLQSYCGGAGVGVEMLASRGRVLAAFQHLRLHEVPVTGGASTYRESCTLDPQLYDYSARLLERLRWTGLAMVEFKTHGGRPVLMEINGRVWGSLPLAIRSGMDFPVLLVRLCLEGEGAFGAEPLRDYKVGVRSRDLLGDVVWISAILAQKGRYPFLPMPNRRRAMTALLGLFDPRRKTDLGAWDDPLPALLQVPKIFPRLFNKARQARRIA